MRVTGMPNRPNRSISAEETSCPAVESAMNALAPTCSVHQLDDATMAMPITPTRYTYHGAPENRSVCRFASRYANSSTSAIACTKKQMPNRLK